MMSKIYRKPCSDGLYLKEVTTVNLPASEVAAFLLDASRWNEWEVNVIESKLLEKLSDNTIITFRKTAAVPLVKQYDMVILESFRTMDDGRIVCIGCSVDHANAPILPKVKRFIMLFVGFVLTPLPDDPNSSLLECMYHADYSKHKFLRFMSRFDFLILNTAERFVTLKKLIEKDHDKT